MPTEERQLAAIMFTDMVGYSVLAQRDEAVALELLEEHRQVVRKFSRASTAASLKRSAKGKLGSPPPDCKLEARAIFRNER